MLCNRRFYRSAELLCLTEHRSLLSFLLLSASINFMDNGGFTCSSRAGNKEIFPDFCQYNIPDLLSFVLDFIQLANQPIISGKY